jgi:hypothetical protein
MSMTSAETNVREVTNYGGLVDALGGAATVVLAIIALSGTRSDILLAIATVVFGAALLIQSGTILSELTHMMFPAGSVSSAEFSGGGLSIMFLVGTAGIVLGVLALLGVYTIELTAIAVIAYGSALVFGSNAVWSIHRMKQSIIRASGERAVSGVQMIATEMSAGSAALQCFAGLGGIVLGILAVTGINAVPLSLVALLAMGATLLLTGGTLSGMVQGFMRPVGRDRASTWSESPAE